MATCVLTWDALVDLCLPHLRLDTGAELAAEEVGHLLTLLDGVVSNILRRNANTRGSGATHAGQQLQSHAHSSKGA